MGGESSWRPTYQNPRHYSFRQRLHLFTGKPSPPSTTFSPCWNLPSSTSLRAIRIPSDSSRKISVRFLNSLSFDCGSPFSSVYTSRRIHRFGKRLVSLRQEGSLQELDESPISIELEPISSETMFDRVITEAQKPDDAVVIVWMANWCRKCIYLKPQLEKLAAEYYPGLRFYHVDVNTVSHKLVERAGVAKMPTIQLWMNGEKRGQLIGGHKAHLVINEIRQMIEDGGTE
ncbi:thioredoxin-like 3-2, chloroplastic [Neltuma alba]|uniref:thioredoxin-like 3-2, chloroplastic n=1 Tax=Neltuma alba TaxID=207710 RepID=UPI0010A593A0|nr:thioredoxin-like 3-2, chloroplastic [Prosopis alba]